MLALQEEVLYIVPELSQLAKMVELRTFHAMHFHVIRYIHEHHEQ